MAAFGAILVVTLAAVIVAGNAFVSYAVARSRRRRHLARLERWYDQNYPANARPPATTTTPLNHLENTA